MRLALMVTVFFAATAQAEFKRLYASRATATSSLQSNWNRFQENYHPTYVLDDDPATAWVEGVEGNGVGESLTVKLSSLKSARKLKLIIKTGFQKSKGLFAANGAPTGLDVTVKDAQEKVTATASLSLAATWGAQTFEVPINGGLSTVTLTITDVREGATYADTCISDVQFFVDSDVPYDKRVEALHRQKMLAWKKDRLAAAKDFQNLKPEWPWKGTQWKRVSQTSHDIDSRYDDDGKENRTYQSLAGAIDSSEVKKWLDAGDIAAMKVMLDAEHEVGTVHVVSSTGFQRVPAGLEQFPSQLSNFIRARDVVLFESKETQLPDTKGFKNLLLIEGTSAAPRKALGKEVTINDEDERSETRETKFTYLEWGKTGLLSRIALMKHDVELEPRSIDDALPPGYGSGWNFTRLEVLHLNVEGTVVTSVELRTLEESLEIDESGDEPRAQMHVTVDVDRYEPMPETAAKTTP